MENKMKLLKFVLFNSFRSLLSNNKYFYSKADAHSYKMIT